MESEEFGSGQPIVEAKIFGKKTDLPADFDIREMAAENLRLAAGGFYQPQEHLDRSAFSGAVGTEKAENLTATHLKRKVTDGDLGAELFAKADGLDGQVIGRRQRVLRLLLERAG